MTVESTPKFWIGDKVHFIDLMYNIVHGTITEINITVKHNGKQKFKYCIRYEEDGQKRFKFLPEELIQHVFDKGKINK